MVLVHKFKNLLIELAPFSASKSSKSGRNNKSKFLGDSWVGFDQWGSELIHAMLQCLAMPPIFDQEHGQQ